MCLLSCKQNASREGGGYHGKRRSVPDTGQCDQGLAIISRRHAGHKDMCVVSNPTLLVTSLIPRPQPSLTRTSTSAFSWPACGNRPGVVHRVLQMRPTMWRLSLLSLAVGFLDKLVATSWGLEATCEPLSRHTGRPFQRADLALSRPTSSARPTRGLCRTHQTPRCSH